MIPIFHASLKRLLCLSLLAVGFAMPVSASTLYDRLGGENGMTAIADSLIDMTAADPATNRTFQVKVNVPRLKKLLAEQLCMLSGGPCPYKGDTMKQSHGGLKISEREFFGMVEHLRVILDGRGVSNGDKNALLAVLAPMKRDIVEKQP